MRKVGIFRQQDVDLTEGSIVPQLIRFAIPLLIGNIFQQLYNTVDTWVVGNYVGNEAFSAVGSVTQVINALIGFFLGFSTGAGVVIAQYYGAGRERAVHDTVHTAITATFALYLVMMPLGLLLILPMLRLMNTPAEVWPEAKAYLSIYFIGIIGLMVYNIGASILHSMGDSIRPFCFLVTTTILNIALDMLFVLRFHMGVRGVAWATVIAQCVSSCLVLAALRKRESCARLQFRDLHINRAILKKIVGIGVPAGIQTSITAFSNVFVHSYIYHFGADCMSGWTAYDKTIQFMFLPMQSLALSVTTFVGQNVGKDQANRAKKGVRAALVLGISITGVLMLVNMTQAPRLIAFFNDKQQVVSYGSTFLRFISPFFILCGVNLILAGALRGAGDSRGPMVIMLSCYVPLRQLYLYIMANFIRNEVIPVISGYSVSWIICCGILILYYRRAQFTRTRVITA